MTVTAKGGPGMYSPPRYACTRRFPGVSNTDPLLLVPNPPCVPRIAPPSCLPPEYENSNRLVDMSGMVLFRRSRAVRATAGGVPWRVVGERRVREEVEAVGGPGRMSKEGVVVGDVI